VEVETDRGGDATRKDKVKRETDSDESAEQDVCEREAGDGRRMGRESRLRAAETSTVQADRGRAVVPMSEPGRAALGSD
jgi:hypothetical protein